MKINVIRNYKFGLLNKLDEESEKGIVDVLFRRHLYRNKRIELHNQYVEQYIQISNNATEHMSQLTQRVNELKDKLSELVKEKKRRRSEARKLKVDCSDFEHEVQEIKEQLKNTYLSIKEEKLHTKETIKPLVDQLQKRHYERVKQARHASNLPWFQSESIDNYFETTVSKALRTLQKLKFQSFDGQGLLSFSTRNKVPLTTQGLFSGQMKTTKITHNQEDLSHFSKRTQRHMARHTLNLRIDVGKDAQGLKVFKHVDMPIVMHRELPEGVVKQVSITRKRIGYRFKYDAIITMEYEVEVPELIDHKSDKEVSLDLGFRWVDGEIRVCTMVDSSNQVSFLNLNKQLVSRKDYTKTLQSRVDKITNRYWAQLKRVIQEDGADNISLLHIFHPILKAAQITEKNELAPVRQMRKLHNTLKFSLTSDVDMFNKCRHILSSWLNEIERPYQEMCDLLRKTSGWRKDIYRNFASNLAKNYASIRLSNLKPSEMLKTKDVLSQEQDLSSDLKARQMFAAWYELRSCIEAACFKHGSAFELVNDTEHFSRCMSCGGKVDIKTHKLNLMCPSCNAVFDRDVNAARALSALEMA